MAQTTEHPYIVTDDSDSRWRAYRQKYAYAGPCNCRSLAFWAHTLKTFRTTFHICLWDRFLMLWVIIATTKKKSRNTLKKIAFPTA